MFLVLGSISLGTTPVAGPVPTGLWVGFVQVPGVEVWGTGFPFESVSLRGVLTSVAGSTFRTHLTLVGSPRRTGGGGGLRPRVSDMWGSDQVVEDR